ncbi:signal peptidase II [Leptolyngbya sp. FACHB-261]|uniref:signal peptidase II n=1 Tax=Leptolyngbya sp. FACHB-261 TaxID=2692806 RepID=UPI001685C3D3|nr:signal peptidase II [Leptolyngbya sp. FACHB-261]MBD2101486.1 lipoprotein signal peptidase [Leptolyngbya sp. FACHB-261]
MEKRIKNAGFWIAGVICLVLDQVSKLWIVRTFELRDSLAIIPQVFHLTYVTNNGAAFSLFANGADWLRWVSLAVSLALVGLALRTHLNRWEQVGYGCILGGALGNGIDRFVSGQVVDFLDFQFINFPIFNLADVSINVGIVCLLISAFWMPSSSNT